MFYKTMFYSISPALTALGTATLFAVVVLVIWPSEHPKRVGGPSTGESCAEFVDRIWPTMSSKPPTPVEQRNMLLCHDALKERFYLERSQPDREWRRSPQYPALNAQG